MTRSKTFIAYTILQQDAERGIYYKTFPEFWTARMEPMQFIAPDATGALADLRTILKDRAEGQWALFRLHHLNGLSVLQPMPPVVLIDV